MRLAFVEAGSDWRSLARLRVVDGKLADYGLVAADTGGGCPVQGAFSIADPRHDGPAKFSNVYRVVRWDREAAAVTSSRDVAVADPRPRLNRSKGDNWYGGGHFGVVPWAAATGAVSAAAGCDNGHWSVADPRLPEPSERLVAVIQSLDGCWHRPFSTLELAVLQSLVEPEEQLELEGLSDAGWRERIGNAVPPDAAQAIAETMGRTLLLAWSGDGFMLSSLPIWVRPVAVALSVQQAGDEATP